MSVINDILTANEAAVVRAAPQMGAAFAGWAALAYDEAIPATLQSKLKAYLAATGKRSLGDLYGDLITATTKLHAAGPAAKVVKTGSFKADATSSADAVTVRKAYAKAKLSLAQLRVLMEVEGSKTPASAASERIAAVWGELDAELSSRVARVNAQASTAAQEVVSA